MTRHWRPRHRIAGEPGPVSPPPYPAPIEGAGTRRRSVNTVAGGERAGVRGQCRPQVAQTVGDRPARNWARLRGKPPAERRVALVLANYPNRDGRIGNGVGLDTAASAIAIVTALAGAGYRIGDMPSAPQALIERLLAGPTNGDPHADATETLGFADYSTFLAALPPAVQQAVAARWGAAERDPFFRAGRLDCGRFAIPGFRAGNIAVLIQPARGYNIDPKATDQALVPPHSYLAAYAWLAQEFRADAIVHLGEDGTLEWLPGEALAALVEHPFSAGLRAQRGIVS